MVIDSAMLVIDDQQQRRLPKFLFAADRVIDVKNQLLSRQHIVVWVLVIGDVGTIVVILVVVVRLKEGILRQVSRFAAVPEIVQQPENLGLVLENIRHAQAATVVIEKKY